ncbi:AAA family ATPase [Microlunatus sp. Gsoil 973]|uniref:ATP-binding protein n=1 Tax=Microlunatus sp. Gsoil 973 TaxID=2672569 RepID=UPI0012B44BD6|nr:ATP-binding protein [Microlunatus sp. Gsoil 973]QGN34796.1 AAA family ATPase [Microlunatus sp. Gsoil 973]
MASDLPLVARDRELSAVTALIESVADGHGQGVLITGEAGIGKTRLLREARTAAEQRGLLVLTGRAIESGGAYRPLVEAFGHPAAPFATHPDLAGIRPALARVLPGWVAENAILAPMADPTAVLATALTLLLQTMAPTGAVLILDDLQWADPDTLATLSSLADSIDNTPLALVAATRGDTPTEPALQQLGGRHNIKELPLRRLTPTEVAEALRGSDLRRLSVDMEQFVNLVDGLPLIMDEFVRQIQDGRSEIGLLGTSSTFSSAVRHRLAGLPSDCRLVLDALSVVGDTDAEVLIATTGLDRQRLGPALHAGLASTLLVPSANSLGVGWRHILIREVVSDLLLPMERQTIGVRAADRLADGSASGDGQLRHAARLYELAGDSDRAAEQLLRAARLAVTNGALDVALEYLSDAQRLTGDIPDSAQQVVIERIQTLCLAGRAGDAYDSGMAALNNVRNSGSRGLLAAVVRAAYMAGLYQEGRELLARLETESKTVDAQLMVLQAEDAIDDDRPDAFDLSRRAAVQAQQEDRIDLACEALMIAGWAATLLNIRQSEQQFRKALELSRQKGLLLWEVRATWGLATLDTITDSDPAPLEQARSLATTAGMVGLGATIDSGIGQVELRRKGFVAAYPMIVEADRQARQLRLLDVHTTAYGRVLDCCLLADQPLPDPTDPEQAGNIDAAIADVMRLETEIGSLCGFTVKSALGARAWLDGDTRSAIRLINEDNQRYDNANKMSPW